MSATAPPRRQSGAGLPPFKLERWFAEHEHAVQHVACASDVEGMGLHDLLWLADSDTRRMWDQLTLGYATSDGHPLLRELIADLYDELEPANVLVTTGAEEALWLLTQALVSPGDHAVVTGPAYQSLTELPREAGADVTVLRLAHTEQWQLRASTFAAALSPRTRLAVLNLPHNPTGALTDAETFRRILGVASDNRIRVISDEVYRFTERDPEDRLPAAADVDERAVSVGVLSKGFGLAGLRIGWIASQDRDLLARCAELKDYTTIAAAAPSEILAIVALQNREEVLRRGCELIGQGFDAWSRFFDRWGHAFEWVPPRAGTVAFPRLTRQVPITEFCSELLRETGVALLPGEVFGQGDGHFRIGMGRRDIDVAVEKLDDFARRWLSAY